MRLDVYVASHCVTCATTLELVEHARQQFPAVTIVVHDIEQVPEAGHPDVFAVPTYVLDGRVLSIGNPSEATLWAALDTPSEPRSFPKRFGRSSWPRPSAHMVRRLVPVGAALSFLSCAGPVAALGAEAFRLAGLGSPPTLLLAVDGYLAPIAEPLLVFGLLCMVAGLVQKGRCPVAFALGSGVLLHFGMVASHAPTGPTAAVDWSAAVLLLAGLIGLVIALVLSHASPRRGLSPHNRSRPVEEQRSPRY